MMSRPRSRTTPRFPTLVAGLALALLAAAALVSQGCAPAEETAEAPEEAAEAPSEIDRKLAKYTSFRLEADLSDLSDDQKQMIELFIDAAKEMDDAFWIQAYGDKDELLASIDDPKVRRFVEINYGPWDRLENNEAFVDGVGPKPLGANFYPADATAEEIAAAAEEDPAIAGLYTMVRREEAAEGETGELQAIPYSQFFGEAFDTAADRLEDAARLAEDEGLRRYLEARARALRTDEYYESDLAWMDMKDNDLDVVIGPIEQYEDKLLGRKTAAEAYVLIKDREWSDRLAKYAEMLPELQRGLPVDAAYKQEEPGTDSDLGAYDVVYYAGDCNAGSKTIAINLPNDEKVQLEKGTRRVQLKNAMRAKFDEILLPISRELIDPDQRVNVTFDAFFGNTMFHEVAHGLGIKETITGKGPVREVLGADASALEEGKADVLGLYMVTELHGQGELGDADLLDNYVTFLASIFRSIRFGSASAHGVANLIRFNYFEEAGAFTRDLETGTYKVDFDKMQEAMRSLSEKILTLQGDGNTAAVDAFIEKYGEETPLLRQDLDRLSEAGIPVDITFEQGVDVLGLE